MKTVKPQKLSVLTRVFENGEDPYLVVTVLACFPIRPDLAPNSLLSEVTLWTMLAEALGKDAPVDACFPKPRGEVLVTGSAFAHGGTPRPAVAARVKIATVDKTILAVGDRKWGFLGASEPEPFVQMPITWAGAFGGEGFAENPLGKGLRPTQTDKGEVHWLPNIEDPKHLIKSPKDKPKPAGFGAYDLTWPQRAGKLGTYDDEWLKTRFPGFAKDLDLGFFSTAPDDQQIQGTFSPDETFTLENLHPEKPILTGKLPGIAVRVFVTMRDKGAPEVQRSGADPAGPQAPIGALREIKTRMDTVHLFPHLLRGFCIFRGLMKIEEEDAHDVVNLLVGAEAAGQEKPLSHYETVLAQRLDRKRGHAYYLKDSDLMPEGPRQKTDERGEMESLIGREDLVRKRLRERAEQERLSAKARVEAAGLDPAAFGVAEPVPEVLPDPDEEDFPALVEKAEADLEKYKAEAESKKREAETRAREQCAAAGIDYDKMMAEGERGGGGPPKFSAEAELQKLRDVAQLCRKTGQPALELEALLADKHHEARLLGTEKQLRDAYKKFAHCFPAADRLGAAEARQLREALIGAMEAGESLAGRDFTRADLSGMDLRGVDLTGTFLEGADLTGANLTGATLVGAVLARVTAEGALFTGVKAAGASFGKAHLARVSFADADLAGAVLAGADLAETSFARADISAADFSEAVFRDTDLRGARGRQVAFLGADLRGLICAGVDLQQSNFIDCKLAGVDFRGADLEKVVFVSVNADGARLDEAKLSNWRVVNGCSFKGATFTGATLTMATVRATDFEGCDFSGIRGDKADFSESNLRGAKLTHAVLREGRFIRSDLTRASLVGANLMEGILQKAILHGANLTGANLFRADLFRIKTDAGTRLDEANLKHARRVVRAGDEQA